MNSFNHCLIPKYEKFPIEYLVNRNSIPKKSKISKRWRNIIGQCSMPIRCDNFSIENRTSKTNTSFFLNKIISCLSLYWFSCSISSTAFNSISLLCLFSLSINVVSIFSFSLSSSSSVVESSFHLISCSYWSPSK